jgi:Kef-type K+ transport system membrane component KefB
MSLLDRVLYRLLPFALCVGLLALLRWGRLGVAGQGMQSTTVALGFLLIGAFISGKTAARLGLPRISGYLIIGILVGPHAIGLLTRDMLAAGKVIEGLAVALISLTAGGEIRLPWVRRQIGRLATMTVCQIVLIGGAIFATMMLLRPIFPFLPADDLHAAIIALVFSAIAVSNSPTVTIAVISENRAEGPLSRTVLGVVVIVDMCVIVLFALVLALARDALGSGGGTSLGVTLAHELGGSVLAGIGFGMGIAWFLKQVGRDTPVFVLAACFAMFAVSQALHLETLLVALAAGFWVENFSDARGEELIDGVERVSLPVYAVFFAAAGAKVDLGALASMWPLALLLCAVRAVCVWAGSTLGARLSGAEPLIRRYTWMGLISQAGVTLALAAILVRSFPEWGGDIHVLIIAMIAVHEIIGPILFQHALRRAGEIGKDPAAAPRG